MNKQIIFVGGFYIQPNGATGGVVTACTSLIEGTKGKIDWLKIDSTAKLPIKPVYVRLFSALGRIFKLILLLLIYPRVKTVLLFSSDGTSFIEKGFMAFLGKCFLKRVVFAPRSGYLIEQLNNSFFRCYVSMIFKFVDVVICQGSDWRKRFLSITSTSNSQKFVVVNNWIDLLALPSQKAEFNTENIKIVFIGWITKAKGIFDLIDAFSSVIKVHDNVHLYIAGDGVDKGEAQSKVRALDIDSKVTFLGWINNSAKDKLLVDSDIFILPSYAEGFPNVVLEAMAVGVPSIVTKVGGVEDLINNYHNGILVDPGNVTELKNAILYMCKDVDIRKAFSVEGRATVLSRFTTDKAITKIIQLL